MGWSRVQVPPGALAEWLLGGDWLRAKRVIICPRLGIPVRPIDCLKCENPCAPRNFLYALLDYVDFVSEVEDEGINVVGVSEITDCPRRAYWRRVEPLEPLSWDSLVRIMLGSAGHQRAAEAGAYSLVWTELPVAVGLNSDWLLLGLSLIHI